MKGFLRAIFAVAAVIVVAAGAAMPPDAIARTARPYAVTRAFDGIWSVEVITQHGDCNPTFRYPLRIWYGRVFKADTDPNYQVAGAVASSGAISVAVTGGGRTARGTGRMSRNDGGGVWQTDTRTCSGIWTAKRRDDVTY
jgi:hypothetical protein